MPESRTARVSATEINPSNRALVSLARAQSYRQGEVRDAVLQSLAPFGGPGVLASPGETVLLKPNLVTYPSENRPSCTHPEVVLAIARLVREIGGRPVIGDSPALGSLQGVATKTGLAEAARAEGIPLQTLSGIRVMKVTLSGEVFHLPVAAEAVKADAIINLPKFKAHRQATLTFGVKNLYGCVPSKRKAFRHFASGGDLDWFCNMLVANAVALRPRFTLVDGIVGMEGQGPTRGNPRPLNVLVGGTDVTAVDSTCCRIVDYPPLGLSTIKAARRLGVGVWDPDRIDLAGEPLETLVVRDFQFAREIPIFFSLPQLLKSCLRSFREMLAPDPSGPR
ncbi:MAG: DUF362 domain-containing protein [Candidatus Omnitrophica bacterium]|nr:hypothetical protein [bacterium]NUN98789.1 DUF362 domain-containing protein [Candidatus Omnitrophota bacterium]